VLAYVIGSRKDVRFLKLQAFLSPFGLTRYYTEKASVYRRHLLPAQHTVGKHSMQKVERKQRFGALPIVAHGKLVGIISRSDLLDAALAGEFLHHT
jgi:insertion element IS1 protein InsB